MKNNSFPNNQLLISCLLLSFSLLFLACGRIDSLNNTNWNALFKKNPNIKTINFAPYEPIIKQSPLIQFILEPKDSLNVAYSNHIKKIANYTKIPFDAITISDWNTTAEIAQTTRVLCILETKNLTTSSIDKIIAFVAKGGTLFIPQAITDARFGYFVGVNPSGDFNTDITSTGIHFTTAFLPNLKGKSIKENAIHYALTANNFSSKNTVLATAANNPKLPVILENKIGYGKVIYFNTTFFLEKADRGLLFAAILNGLEGIPYPIANTSTIFLDDFPSPLYDIKIEPIASEMNLNLADFITKVWWPDMKKLAKKYNISYTAIPCFDYNTNTEPAFDFSQWDAKKMAANPTIETTSSWLMRDCLKNGHELGFHGYNHVSLVANEWSNTDYIPIAFQAVQKKWLINNFDNLPKSYVPPSNVIDKIGVDKLRIGLPSLQFMCSVYTGDLATGGEREFDFDPYDPTLFDYPRNTSGFYMDDDNKYTQQSLYLFTGIWTHFVHPDDVYQIASSNNKSNGNFDLRNSRNIGWRTTKGKKEGMFYEFDACLNEVTQLFPKIRFLNANQAGNVVYNWRASSFKHSNQENKYTVERNNQANTTEQYWFLYVSQDNVATVDLQLINQQATAAKTPFQHGFLYTIATKNGKISLTNVNQKPTFTNDQLLAEINKQKNNYNSYLIAYKKSNAQKNSYWVDDYDIKLKQEIARLKTKMLTENTIDYSTWNSYANYMSWTNQQSQVWKMLLEKCNETPSSNNIMYARELNKQIGYPDEETENYWLQKQLTLFPDDIPLLNQYINAFNTPENNKEITKAYQKLLKAEPNSANYLKYIEHILAYEPLLALQELENTTPSSKLQPLAYPITWLFADNKQYKRAYEWSKLSDKVEFKSQLYWLQELKENDELETQYLIYSSQNPDDYEVRAIMSSIYHQNNRFKDAWILANSLPESKEKNQLQKTLNTDVVYVDRELQWELIDHYPELFYPEIKNKIIKDDRLLNGNYIDFASKIGTNRTEINAFDNVLSYTFFSQNKNSHTLSATYSEYSPIDLIAADSDNIFHSVKGIQYKYKNPFSSNKLQYWASSRIEIDNYNQLFYHLGLGANLSKLNNYKSLELKFSPTETAAAYSKNIYQLRINFYQEYYWLHNIDVSFSLEGNYYTQSTEANEIDPSSEYEGSLTTKITWDKKRNKKFSFVPFLETALTKASTTYSSGYPYWIIKNRFNGGGGLSARFGTTESNFKSELDAAYFYDDFSENFKRFTSKTSYQLLDFTALTFSFELYVQSKFYSNNFQFGLKHNFKVKRKP